MLSPNETTKWIEKPGNPNFMIPAPVEAETATKTMKTINPPETIPLETDDKPKLELAPFEEIEEQIGAVLYNALQPLYFVIGMIEAESGKTLFYRFGNGSMSLQQKMTPLNWGSKDATDFKKRQTPILGDTLTNGLLGYFTEYKPIGASWFSNRVGIPDEYLPEWVWCQMEEPVFRFIVNQNTFGALQLAANELQFPLKSLISSSKVNYMFAQFVARKFVAPKSNAYASGVSGGQMQYRISSGFNTSTMANTKWLMGCKLWFKGVYFADNPEAKPTSEEIRVVERHYNERPSQQLLNELENLKLKYACFEEKILVHE